jgi:hypothetical protein
MHQQKNFNNNFNTNKTPPHQKCQQKIYNLTQLHQQHSFQQQYHIDKKASTQNSTKLQQQLNFNDKNLQPQQKFNDNNKSSTTTTNRYKNFSKKSNTTTTTPPKLQLQLQQNKLTSHRGGSGRAAFAPVLRQGDRMFDDQLGHHAVAHLQ